MDNVADRRAHLANNATTVFITLNVLAAHSAMQRPAQPAS